MWAERGEDGLSGVAGGPWRRACGGLDLVLDLEVEVDVGTCCDGEGFAVMSSATLFGQDHLLHRGGGLGKRSGVERTDRRL